MNRPKSMLVANIAWARETRERAPGFFDELARGQNPRVLWIGCSDSRVPAETITHSAPGDLFVHRNIANLFQPDDDNSASVLEYAVRVLEVDHVIVCGHYGCGGVRASLLPPPSDLPHVARRIAPLCALARRYRDALAGLDDTASVDRLAELNVLEQVRQLRASSIVRDRERSPLVHGWIFSLADGHLMELDSGYATPPADAPARPAMGAALAPALG
ncbi:carbonic anhydrase [Burkholderia cepacia]|uniref:carbonic anhydrase n=2 Tax=Burkholderia cepacia TaxID=292 RepID=UPI000759E93B|nr:carbonic anhydrase [Burkholderia cepacia]KVS60396.1 carbonic anhydrase [Burkholderia cepacia]RQT71290.1 carbonic anhydrase [Burkholderia cepacia]RQT91841.1 carbonic anhydrase [Burkholderia cepacia]RQZ67926.1 carbonic anhydrase [Burkholderia cepacia]